MSSLLEERVRVDVARRMSPRRWRHSLAVAETARGLAERHGADPGAAAIAGLLHDCAREIPPVKLLRLAAEYGLSVDEIEARQPLLLHGKVGAALAAKRFRLRDRDVLAAIELHITGAPGMPLLARLIFLADFIAPGREHAAVGKARRALDDGLDDAVLLVLDATIVYVLSGRYLLHPRTVAARNELLCARARAPGPG